MAWSTFNLETGTYPLTAFWNGVNVGETTITVTGNATFTLQCQLTDLKITVQNENGVPMPFVNLTITYQYQPTTVVLLKQETFQVKQTPQEATR